MGDGNDHSDGFLASSGLPAQSAKPPQPEVTPTISLQTYQRILDLAFATRGSAGSRPFLGLTVRIMPAFDPESQVAMVLAGAGSAKVDFVVASENMFYAANTLLRSTGENRAEMLAPKLSVKHYNLSISSERVLRWQTELFQSLIPTLTTMQDELNDKYQGRPVNLLLDGSTYELWFTQGSQDIHISVPEGATPSALVKWAEQVHSDIANIAKGFN